MAGDDTALHSKAGKTFSICAYAQIAAFAAVPSIDQGNAGIDRSGRPRLGFTRAYNPGEFVVE